MTDKRLIIILGFVTVNFFVFSMWRLALWIGPWGLSVETHSFGLGAIVQGLATGLVIFITEWMKYIRGEPPTKASDVVKGDKE